MAVIRLCLAASLLGSLILGGAPGLCATAAPAAVGSPLQTGATAPEPLLLAQTQNNQETTPAPAGADAAPAQDAQAEPIGNVVTLSGTATVIRNKDSIALKLKDDIYLNDTVQTSAGALLSITFSDDTTFRLSANAKITIDSYIYDPSGKQNAGAFDIAKGTVAFVAAAVARTGDMKITTPTATLGIRGTTGLVDVPEGATATGTSNVAIKLYPDADGRVGHIDVNDRQGARLGALTQGASGFSIRPGTGGARFAAVPLTISPREAARDRGFVSELHAAQTTGRQIVSEQRAFRRANPNFNRNAPAARPPGANTPNRSNQPGQPGANPNRGNQPEQPQRQNGAPGELRQPGSPGRQGEPQRPGQPSAPGQTPPAGQPQRAGERPKPGQPGTPPQPAVQPRPGALPGAAPGAQRPALQRPGQQRPGQPPKPAPRRPPPPKGKRENQR